MNFIKKIIFSLITILFCISNIYGYAYQKELQTAEKYYSQGKYSEALKIYLGFHVNNGKLYYNIGNCYYKLNKLGYAIAYYKKAEKLLPNNTKLIENLNLLNSLKKDKFDVKKNTLTILYEKIQKTYTVNQGKLILLILIWLFFIFLSLFVFFRKQFFIYLTIIVFLIAIPVTFLFLTKIYANPEAVIVAEQSILFGEPSKNSKELSKLHSGTSLEIISENNNFYNVIIAGIRKGWLKKQDIMLVD